MALFSRVHVWVSNEILTAAAQNAEFDNILSNSKLQSIVGYSANASQMQTTTSPGTVGSESLAASGADELARLRYMLKALGGGAQWYSTPSRTFAPGALAVQSADYIAGSVNNTAMGNNAVSANNVISGSLTVNDLGVRPGYTKVGFYDKTTQRLTASAVAASGSYIITNAAGSTTPIAYNATVATIQGAIQSISGFSNATVTATNNIPFSGFPSSLTIQLNGVVDPGAFSISSNTLQTAGSAAITVNVFYGISILSTWVAPITNNNSIAPLATPVSGTFALTYNGNSTAGLAYNASASAIQTQVRTLAGLSAAVVTGTMSGGGLLINVPNVVSPFSFTVTSNTMVDSLGNAITFSINAWKPLYVDTIGFVGCGGGGAGGGWTAGVTVGGSGGGAGAAIYQGLLNVTPGTSYTVAIGGGGVGSTGAGGAGTATTFTSTGSDGLRFAGGLGGAITTTLSAAPGGKGNPATVGSYAFGGDGGYGSGGTVNGLDGQGTIYSTALVGTGGAGGLGGTGLGGGGGGAAFGFGGAGAAGVGSGAPIAGSSPAAGSFGSGGGGAGSGTGGGTTAVGGTGAPGVFYIYYPSLS